MLRFKRVPMQLQHEIVAQDEEGNEAIIKSSPNPMEVRNANQIQREVNQKGKKIIIRELITDNPPPIKKRKVGHKMKNKN